MFETNAIGIVLSTPVLEKGTSKRTGKEYIKTRLSVAVRNGEKAGDKPASVFMDFDVWNHDAEYLVKYCEKGAKVFVRADIIDARPYERKDGTWAASIVTKNVKVEILSFVPKPQSTVDEPVQEHVDASHIDVTNNELPF